MQKRNDSLWKLLLIASILPFSGCAQLMSPYEYGHYNSLSNKKVVIKMDNTMHLTPDAAIIDSASLVYRLMNRIMAKPQSRVKFVVYFNGAGPNDYRLASLAAYVLKDTLVHHHYPKERIDYEVKFFIPKSYKLRYPYQKVDFIVTNKQ